MNVMKIHTVTNNANSKLPSKRFDTKNIVITVIIVGNFPLQGTSELVMTAKRRSLGEFMILAPVTPHALQPNPMHMVRACFPQALHFAKGLSKLKAILGRKPESSNKVKSGKNIAIGGSMTAITRDVMLNNPSTKSDVTIGGNFKIARIERRPTSKYEKKLDKIGAGELDWVKTIADFYDDFDSHYKKAEQSLDGKRVKVPAVETDVVCEKCGRKMVEKSGRFGKFLACPGYPECKNTKPMPEDEIKQPCPKCGSPLLKKISKKGKKFYGCSNYPKCDFASPGIPTGEICAECGGYIISGIRGRKYCMNSECTSRQKSQKKEK